MQSEMKQKMNGLLKRLVKVWLIGGLLALPLGLYAQDTPVADNHRDTITITPYHFNPSRLILPATLIAVGALGTAIDGMSDYHLFERSWEARPLKVDDYMEWGMFGLVFVNDLIGKEKHNWVDQLFLLGLSEGLNALMVQSIKHGINEPRPNGNSCSFPSGHTANAFLGAHLNFKEFKDSSMLLALSGYPLAAFVAFSRIYGNRHWMADVVAGAGFGILSVELAYLAYFPIRNAIVRSLNMKHNTALFVAPTIHSGGAGLHLSYTF